MRVVGFDKFEHNINLNRYTVQRKTASKLHIKARCIIKDLFPLEQICEEVTLPGSKRGARKNPLYADFLIPGKKLLIEVDGAQHDKYNTFHYGSKLDFMMAKKRDKDKQEWADLNNLDLIRLKHNESEDEWREKILER